jgi:hypothetical protein
MLIPLDKETGKRKTKLTDQEKKDLTIGKARSLSKPRPKRKTVKHPGLRQPKPEKKSGSRSSR